MVTRPKSDDPGVSSHGNVKCRAIAKSTGRQCGTWVDPDIGVCRKHGGAAPQVIAHAEKRREARELREQVQLFGLPIEVDPSEALLGEVHRSAGVVAWLDAEVRRLDPDGLWWGLSSHDEGVGPEGPIDKRTYKAETPVVVRMWQDERRHLAQVAAAAVKAGIEERRVRIAESQAAQISGVFQRVLGALGLDAERVREASAMVARELRALDGGAA